MEPVIPTPEVTTVPNTVPKLVFVVPYRDREPHRVFFSTYINKIMEDVPSDDWTFFFIHQNDKRPFNRGAMKNIGFLALKYAYPDDYKNIIFIFNDVDTLPYDKNVLNYHTEHGVVKHFYGFQFALGGIFSIRGGDFERINGFPNYWAWGGEDNLINQRAKQHGLIIDRSNFYTIGNMKILQFADGLKRLICRDELATSIMPNNSDGLSKLTNLTYMIYNETHMIDVASFNTYIDYSQLHFEEQALDKIHKIRVSPLNAMRNIKQLQNDYVVDVNKHIHSIEYKTASTHKIEEGVNTVNMPVRPQMPFMFNHNVGRRNIGLILPQNRPIVTEESRQNAIAAAAVVSKLDGNQVNRMYQNYKKEPDITIPLQRPNTSSGGIHGHKQFGMRALFM